VASRKPNLSTIRKENEMRKLTKLESKGMALLLEETARYLDGTSKYDLQPCAYYGPRFLLDRKPASTADHLIAGGFVVSRHTMGDGEAILSISLYFPRPSRDWTMTAMLNTVKRIEDIRQVNISKEYKGMGNGQYLIAEHMNGKWAITASEYD